MKIKIHPTADVASGVSIGDGTVVWNWAQICGGVRIGKNCIIAKGVHIGVDVTIGNNVKIENNVSVFKGVILEDGVFVGPHVCFTNDKNPRSLNIDGSFKKGGDWNLLKTIVKKGASIGANSTILPGLIIGEFAMIGAGSIVTKDVLMHGLVFGNPSSLRGWVCKCAKIISKEEIKPSVLLCKECLMLDVRRPTSRI